MSYFRQIHTSIWKDEDFLEFTPEEKLLFVYFFSNESTTLSGLYKIPLRVIAFETNLPMDFIKTTLKKFEKLEKIFYRDGMVFVKNFQRYNKGGDTVAKAIHTEIENTQDCELKDIYLRYYSKIIAQPYPIDTLLQEEYSKEEKSIVKKSIGEFLSLPIPESPLEADNHPLIQLFRIGCDYSPPSKEYKNIIDIFGLVKDRYKTYPEIVEDIKKYSIAWTSRINKSGKHYSISNLVWFYNWLLNESIPEYNGGNEQIHVKKESYTGKIQLPDGSIQEVSA
jgi:hypothetical protein